MARVEVSYNGLVAAHNIPEFVIVDRASADHRHGLYFLSYTAMNEFANFDWTEGGSDYLYKIRPDGVNAKVALPETNGKLINLESEFELIKTLKGHILIGLIADINKYQAYVK